MLEAESVNRVWQLYVEIVGELGFTRVLYGYNMNHQSDPYGLDHVLTLSNHEAAYLDTFIGKGLYRDAPMVRWASKNVGWASWQRVADAYVAGELTPAERRVVEFNRSMGVTAGYSVSFKDVSTRAKGAVGLVGAPGVAQAVLDEIWAREKRHLVALSTTLHLKVTSLPRRIASPLTQRQREALEWVAQGKTTQDIAILMGISAAMVEKHLRLAREALDVDTTAHAVAKASQLAQIFITET